MTTFDDVERVYYAGSSAHSVVTEDKRVWPTSGYSREILKAAPVHYFPMDERTAPSVDLVTGLQLDHANNPVVGAAGLVPGKTRSIEYNRSLTPEHSNFTSGIHTWTQPMLTLSVWLMPYEHNTDPVNNDYRNIIFAQTNTFVLLEQNAAISFRIPWVDTANPTFGNAAAMVANHFVGVYDGRDPLNATRTWYLNGVQVGQYKMATNLTNYVPKLGTFIRIGSQSPTSNMVAFRGRIQGVALFEKVVTAADVQRWYSA